MNIFQLIDLERIYQLLKDQSLLFVPFDLLWQRVDDRLDFIVHGFVYVAHSTINKQKKYANQPSLDRITLDGRKVVA
jgi:hypothetical protein